MSANDSFVDLNEHLQFPAGGIFSKVLKQTDTCQYTLMCLSQGSGIETHTSAKSGSVHVVKGRGTFVLQDQEIALKPGVLIFMPAGAPHSLKADEDLAILLSLCARS